MAKLSRDWSNQVVLLAEDNDDEVVLFKRAYKRAGINHSLQIVRDGEEAIAYLKGEGKFSNRRDHPFPILLLLDLQMPRKDGLQVLQWVRKQPLINRLRIIVISGREDVEAARMAYHLGANLFLIKPVDSNVFIDQLKHINAYWLNLSRAPDISSLNSGLIRAS